jgi:hypothetical protein
MPLSGGIHFVDLKIWIGQRIKFDFEFPQGETSALSHDHVHSK